MSYYTPDSWVLIRVKTPGEDMHFRVLAGWGGGYLSGNSWKLNSGITSFTEDDRTVKFTGESGSVYECYKSGERFTGYTAAVYAGLQKDLTSQGGTIFEHIDFEEFRKEWYKSGEER